MIKPLKNGDVELGQHFETEFAKFVFGNSTLSRDRLSQDWPEHQFHLTKQVHGVHIQSAPFAGTPEADGQYTQIPGAALTVQTADCVPILLANLKEASALHAGWRGAASGIVQNARGLFQQAPQIALIGPHIQFSSFEVGRDVADQLLKALPSGQSPKGFTKPHANSDKVYFNLRELIAAQLRALYPRIQILSSESNTIVDRNFHSFRRDGKQAGRQYSFVVLKP